MKRNCFCPRGISIQWYLSNATVEVRLESDVIMFSRRSLTFKFQPHPRRIRACPWATTFISRVPFILINTVFNSTFWPFLDTKSFIFKKMTRTTRQTIRAAALVLGLDESQAFELTATHVSVEKEKAQYTLSKCIRVEEPCPGSYVRAQSLSRPYLTLTQLPPSSIALFAGKQVTSFNATNAPAKSA